MTQTVTSAHCCQMLAWMHLTCSADFWGWTVEGQSFRFPTSLMTSSRSLCKPCTQLSTRAKLESLKVPLERCVCMLGHCVRPEMIALFCMICVFNTCFGTQGKSLSLICGALSWLTDFEERRRQETAALLQKGEAALSSAAQSSSSYAEPDWITDFVQKKAERDLVSKLKVKMSCFINVGFLNPTTWWFFIRMRNWKDRSEKNDWKWSEAMFS